MSTPSQIKDGTGQPYAAKVTPGNAVKVTNVPPSGLDLSDAELARFQYFNTYFLNGTSPDMNVDGSVTPVTFQVSRAPGQLLYIKRVRFVFHDEQMDMSGGEAKRFGSVANDPGLTNGLRFFTDQTGLEINAFNEPVRTMADFWQYADDFVSVTSAIAGGNNIDFLSWDIVFVREVVITQGSIDRLAVVVSDDLTSMDLFRVIATGFREVVPST